MTLLAAAAAAAAASPEAAADAAAESHDSRCLLDKVPTAQAFHEIQYKATTSPPQVLSGEHRPQVVMMRKANCGRNSAATTNFTTIAAHEQLHAGDGGSPAEKSLYACVHSSDARTSRMHALVGTLIAELSFTTCSAETLCNWRQQHSGVLLRLSKLN